MRIRVSRGRAALLAAVGVGIGLAYLAAFWIGGKPRVGVIALALMLAVTAAFLLLARRSETVAGLVDHSSDERIADIDWRAVAISGLVTGVVIIGGAIYEFANGNSGAPYTWLALVMALSYVVSVVWQRWRR